MKDFLKGLVFFGLFLIPFIPLIVTDSMFFPFITGKNFTFRIVVEIIFAAWILLALLDVRYRPRFSWIFSSISVLLVVMFFANLFGEYPLKSFWSNFERMDGYVTLIHFYLFFVVLGSTLKNDRTLWMRYFWTTVAAAGYVAFDGLQQFINKIGSWRVDSTLGNAAYMAIYMLFHAFFSLYLVVQSKQWWTRSIAGILFILFVVVLILTATRGTFLGLAAGLGVTVLYLIIFAKSYPVLRKAALGGLIALVMFVGGIFVFKDSSVIAENRILERISSISLDDLAVRFDIWEMAFEGVKERPILGWGQGNFNYIFNEQYNPDLYFAEAWYDRAHNVVLDWLTAGGILGFLAYISIFVALAFYLIWRPLMRTREEAGKVDEEWELSVGERAVLTGLIVAYFTHNLVVFDNIVSFIFFAVTVAFIHGRIGTIVESVKEYDLDPRIVTNIVTPVVVVLAGTVIYFANVPGISASGDIIRAITSPTIPERLGHMESAINRNSFAYQEVVEQLAQQAMQIAANANIPNELKTDFVNRAETELLNLAVEKPGDARVHVFISGFYRSIGQVTKAREHIAIARELSPNKQAIIMEQGVIEFQLGNYPAMVNFFKEAFELQEENGLARTFYAASLLYIGDRETFDTVITEEHMPAFARQEFGLQAASQNNQPDLMVNIFEVRSADNPQDAQLRASLAFLKNEAGDVAGAIEVLESAVSEIESFKTLGLCYIANLEVGNPPDQDCRQTPAVQAGPAQTESEPGLELAQ